MLNEETLSSIADIRLEALPPELQFSVQALQQPENALLHTLQALLDVDVAIARVYQHADSLEHLLAALNELSKKLSSHKETLWAAKMPINPWMQPIAQSYNEIQAYMVAQFEGAESFGETLAERAKFIKDSLHYSKNLVSYLTSVLKAINEKQVVHQSEDLDQCPANFLFITTEEEKNDLIKLFKDASTKLPSSNQRADDPTITAIRGLLNSATQVEALQSVTFISRSRLQAFNGTIKEYDARMQIENTLQNFSKGNLATEFPAEAITTILNSKSYSPDPVNSGPEAAKEAKQHWTACFKKACEQVTPETIEAIKPKAITRLVDVANQLQLAPSDINRNLKPIVDQYASWLTQKLQQKGRPTVAIVFLKGLEHIIHYADSDIKQALHGELYKLLILREQAFAQALTAGKTATQIDELKTIRRAWWSLTADVQTTSSPNTIPDDKEPAIGKTPIQGSIFKTVRRALWSRTTDIDTKASPVTIPSDPELAKEALAMLAAALKLEGDFSKRAEKRERFQNATGAIYRLLSLSNNDHAVRLLEQVFSFPQKTDSIVQSEDKRVTSFIEAMKRHLKKVFGDKDPYQYYLKAVLKHTRANLLREQAYPPDGKEFESCPVALNGSSHAEKKIATDRVIEEKESPLKLDSAQLEKASAYNRSFVRHQQHITFAIKQVCKTLSGEFVLPSWLEKCLKKFNSGATTQEGQYGYTILVALKEFEAIDDLLRKTSYIPTSPAKGAPGSFFATNSSPSPSLDSEVSPLSGYRGNSNNNNNNVYSYTG